MTFLRAVALVMSLFILQSSGFSVSSSKSNNKKLLTNDRKGGGSGFGVKRNVVPTTHTPDTSSTTEALVNFLQFQKSKGLNDGVEIGYSSTGLRGMYTTCPFKKGELLCQIPSDCALALSDPELGGDDVPTMAHSGRNLILMYLNDEKAKQLWKPYLDTLPTREKQFDPTPDFFLDEEIQQLEFPRAVERAQQRKQEIESLAKKEEITMEELQFATWLVSSRSFSIAIFAGDAVGDRISKPSKSIRVLLPYLDMINHSSNNPNVELHLIDPEKDDAWVAIRATQPIQAGKQVTICYGTGVDSSVELQENYGFVPDDNKIDALMLKKGGEGCIEDESRWSTTLDEDLAAYQTAEGNMRNVLALRIKLKKAYADINK